MNFILLFLIKIKRKFEIKYFLLFFIISNLLFFRIIILETNYEKTYYNIEQVETIAEVVSNVEEKEYTNKYIIKIINLNNSLKFKNTKLIFYSKNNKYKYGDIIYIKGKYQKPQGKRNENGYNYSEYLKQSGIFGILQSEKDKKINQKDSIFKFINDLNFNSSKVLYQIYDNQEAEILDAILLGNKGNLEDDTVDIFSRSSLSHILAISGLHINYITETLRKILDKIINSRFKKNLIIIFFLIMFCIFTRGSPSCIRACFMICFGIIGEMFFRKAGKINSICFSLLFILLYNPYYIQNVGLWLSFGGIIGINLFKDIIKYKSNNKILSYIITNLNQSISVQIIIFPIILYNFNSISLTFFISNILVSFLILPIIVLGYLSIFLAIISCAFSKVTIGFIQSILVKIFLSIGIVISKIKFSSLIFITPSIISIILYYIILVCIKFKKISFSNIYHKLFLFLLIVIIIISNLNIKLNKNLEINFLDVGQGDSCLIISPNNKKILIDGGEKTKDYDYGKKVVLPYLLDKKINSLDYIIISHFDSDHVRTDLYIY